MALACSDSTLELAVHDDGKGLSADQFNRATGGLRNVQRWSQEESGTLRRIAAEAGTSLVATLELPR